MMNTTFWDKLSVKSYKSMLKHKPDYPLLHNNLGLAYVRLQQYPQAIRSFKKAIQGDKAATDAPYHLACLYRQLGKDKEALAQLQDYIKINVAKSCVRDGRESVPLQEMQQQLEKRIKITPQSTG